MGRLPSWGNAPSTSIVAETEVGDPRNGPIAGEARVRGAIGVHSAVLQAGVEQAVEPFGALGARGAFFAEGQVPGALGAGWERRGRREADHTLHGSRAILTDNVTERPAAVGRRPGVGGG